MKYLYPLLLFFSISNISCSAECQGALADLTTNLATSVIGTVLAGQPFSIGATILNSVPVVSTCIGNEAGSSNSNYAVNYGTSSGNFTSEELNDNYSIPPIQAGSSFKDNFETTFTQPGFYELITITDFFNQVEEENENNNTYDGEVSFRSSSMTKNNFGNPHSRLVFEVLPNPNYIPEKGTPKVIMIRK